MFAFGYGPGEGLIIGGVWRYHIGTVGSQAVAVNIIGNIGKIRHTLSLVFYLDGDRHRVTDGRLWWRPGYLLDDEVGW